MRTALLVALVALSLCSSPPVRAESAAPPDTYREHPPPPADYHAAPDEPVHRRPLRTVDPTPPPLSPAMRVAYAPFYAAGVVLHYAFYYTVVAPLEVFHRALTYGADAGVEKP